MASYSQLSLSVTVLLTLTVFLLLVAETLPTQSDSVPLIGQCIPWDISVCYSFEDLCEFIYFPLCLAIHAHNRSNVVQCNGINAILLAFGLFNQHGFHPLSVAGHVATYIDIIVQYWPMLSSSAMFGIYSNLSTAQFFGANILLLAVSTAMTVLVLNVHHRGSLGNPVPAVVQLVVLNWLARMLGLRKFVHGKSKINPNDVNTVRER